MKQSLLHENISRVRSRLTNAARNANRADSDIRLIAVSKTKPVDAIREAFEAGIRDFGENYVSEGVEKCQQCRSLDITWHFLGPLQSNKTRLVAEHFDWIHSVDR
ncbi:MAG: YggS family pyridoxal phosphate-dependent enzyme, partial [Luminiphilus sp.]|nr:YggS family pyridoxal phosphate-dependent enzyme [Luminiphilus sp.]